MLEHIYGMDAMGFLHDDVEDYLEDSSPLHVMAGMWNIGERFGIRSLTAKIEAHFRAVVAPNRENQALRNCEFYGRVAHALYNDEIDCCGLKDILVENMVDHYGEHCEDWWDTKNIAQYPRLAYQVMDELSRRLDVRNQAT